MESKCNANPWGYFWARRKPMGQGSTRGTARGEQHSPGCTRRPMRALWGSAYLGCPRTASLLYKYPNILETLGEATKYWSSRHRVQNHQIQSRHRHGGVHHFHWCLSYDAWVARWLPLSLLIINTMVTWRSIWWKSFGGVFVGIRWTLSLWSDLCFYPWKLFKSSLISYMHDCL